MLTRTASYTSSGPTTKRSIPFTAFAKRLIDSQSAFYVDEERGGCDAETSLQYITLEAIANEARNHKFSGDGKVDPEVEKVILQKIHEKHAAHTPHYGMEVLSVELRGVWKQSDEVPLRIYSLEPEAPRPDIQQSILPNDYWGEVMEPMPFKRYTYGSEKMIDTPAVTSLEWAIPSPPDYHHYNMVSPPCCALHKLCSSHHTKNSLSAPGYSYGSR